MSGIAKFSLAALDCADPEALADFYSHLTGWPVGKHDHDGWTELVSPQGATLAFQRAPDHRPATWPSGDRPLQIHLDFDVADLDEAEPRVLALGATKAGFQPHPESFRVYLDPSGQPFCLVLEH